MNKLLIGLLIIAAGTAAYFVFRKKNDAPEIPSVKKEFIIGQWKGTDTTRFYDFRNDGTVLHSGTDSLYAGTSFYEWNKLDGLVWKQDSAGAVSMTFVVARLTTDTLLLQSPDSVSSLFTRRK